MKRSGKRWTKWLASLAALAALSSWGADEAHAVVQTSGVIEIDPALDRSTLDIHYFDLSAPVVDADFLFSVVSPVAGDSLAAALFDITGGGSWGSLIAIQPGAPGLDAFLLTQSLAAGSYAFVVGLYELSAGEFPPFQVDPNTPASSAPVEYEISIAGFDDAVSFTCRRQGGLDGSVGLEVFVPDSRCPAPPAKIAEPGTLALLFGGLTALAGLGGLRFRRSGAAAKA